MIVFNVDKMNRKIQSIKFYQAHKNITITVIVQREVSSKKSDLHNYSEAKQSRIEIHGYTRTQNRAE